MRRITTLLIKFFRFQSGVVALNLDSKDILPFKIEKTC